MRHPGRAGRELNPFASQTVVARPPVDSDRCRVVAAGRSIGDGKVWLAACGLVQIDIDEAEIVQSNDDADACGPIACGAGAVWSVSGRSLVKLDPVTGEEASARLPGLERRLRLPDRPRDIVIAGGAVWVATDRGRLVSVDPRSAETITSVDLGGGSLSHVAAGFEAIWVTSYEDD